MSVRSSVPDSRKSVLALAAAALLAGSVIYFLGDRNSQGAQADGAATTNSAAATAGARVLPTDPKLNVEPK
jgi:hypothetical protein